MSKDSVTYRNEFEHEEKIFEQIKGQLGADGLVVFAFRGCKDGLWQSKYIDGEFNERDFLFIIESAVHCYKFVERRRKELLEAVVSGEGKINFSSSDALFRMEGDFERTIAEMEAGELRQHMVFAREQIKDLREEIEDLSFQDSERQKHGAPDGL
jgi:hypothetical protein